MAEIKIGIVDYARLFEESPQAKVVRETLQAEFGPRLQQLVTQENALKARGEKLQKDVATMTPDQRSKAEKDIRDPRASWSARKASCRTIRTSSARKR
jgi:outer membrane protein